MKDDQIKYGNDWERTVLGKDDIIDTDIYAREIARYRFASQYVRSGMRVLEIGCSSGFGTGFLPRDIEYLGVDYSKEIIGYAERNFGDKTHEFLWSSIDKFLEENKEHFDVIIAFEVLEHIKNGREVAQALKERCDTLLLTTPYREPVGFWGKHHVLHGLSENDFPGFEYKFMHINGAIETYPTVEIANLLLMVWERGKEYKEKKKILCCIPTKNRYDALFQCLQAVAFQTVKPDKVIVYDDGEQADLRDHPVGRYIFPLLQKNGIPWEVVFTPKRGQHVAHQMANTSGYDFVWRLDDDNVPKPDVLERLLYHMKDDVGAVGGAVYELNRIILGGTSKIKDFFHKGNVQWGPDQGVHDVDFLYSSFLYRAGIVDYKHKMSTVAFHEETIFTHRMKRAGWKLIADTSIHTYHFKSPHGGCRAADLEWAYAFDHQEFMKIMENEFGIKLIHLGVGIGDNFAFKHILPELKKKYDTVIIGTCYEEVFAGEEGIMIIPYSEAKRSSDDNVYDWMAEHNWKGSLIDAYRKMYL